jgi:hypothetical protein
MEAATAPPATDPETPPLPGEDPDADAPEENELVVEGDQPQLSLAIGGKKATASSLSLQGGEVKIAGQFDKGTRVRFMVEGTIDEVALRDHRDRKTGTITAVKRAHKFTIENIERIGG